MTFEYHGRQHFEVLGNYTKDEAVLSQRMQDDNLKAALCRKHGVHLFLLDNRMPYESFAENIKTQAIALGIDLGIYNFEAVNIDINRAYIRKDRIEELKAILFSKQIKLISEKWLGTNYKYHAECLIDGHKWSATGDALLSGSGCKRCQVRNVSEPRKGSVHEVSAYARQLGGELLSDEYVGAAGKYQFKCSEGYVFEMKLNNMKFRKAWCPECKRMRKGK